MGQTNAVRQPNNFVNFLHKLTDAGVMPGDKFPRGLLLDLYRFGDAYTGGGGVGTSLPSAGDQLEMDFENDPDSETAFPACDTCGSIADLHLILRGDKNGLAAKLECTTCRGKPSVQPLDTSVPVALMSRSLFSRLCQLKPVAIKGKNITRFQDLLNAEFESKWENLRTSKGKTNIALRRS